MMNIVIMGAGDLGRHVAALLSKEKHNVILIDKDGHRLQEASSAMDVATRHGSGTDWQLLEDLLEFSPDLYIGLTGNEETNLVGCSIAKNLKFPRTIARVRNERYLNRTRLDFSRLFDVDYFIGPELLVAHDILKYILSPGSLFVEHFSHGALQLLTLKIPDNWRKDAPSLKSFKLPENIIVGLIYREDETQQSSQRTKRVIFPHGEDRILPGDEVTFIGSTDTIADIHHVFEIPQKTIRSAVIIGGSLTGLQLARLLSARDIYVRIIDKSYEKCLLLADRLPKCTVMHHDGTDINFLRGEKIGSADIVIGCTNNDEVNILTAALGKEIGCDDALVVLANPAYLPLATKLGLGHTLSPRIVATNHILSQLFSGKVNSLVSLYDNQAEIMELNVSLDSKIVGIPLSELGPFLPKDFLIVMIQNRGRIMIAHGNRIMSPGDTVIVVTSPKHVNELKKIF